MRLLYEHLNPLGLGEHGCPCVVIDCPLRCGEKYLRSELEEHKQSKCPKRMAQCQFCKQLYVWETFTQEHSGVCPKEPVDCPNGCKSPLLRDQVQNHLDSTSDLEAVKCSFNECSWEAKRKDLKTHLGDK